MEPSSAHLYAAFALDAFTPGQAPAGVSRWADKVQQPYMQDGVYVLPVTGALLKNEYCDSPGTSNMLTDFNQALTNAEVKGIVLQIDSPGGSVDGLEVFASAIKASTKPVVAFVDGMMASAAYRIGSSASLIIASTATDMVGSIGTMVQWADFTEAYKQRGITLHEAYATESTDKNRVLKEATATGNYTNLVTTLLDPVNDSFLSAVKANRPGINLDKENVLTGKVYMAKEAIKYGLVDKIGSLQSAIKTARNISVIQNKNTTMSTTQASPFARTLVAAGAESFTVNEDGFALTEQNLTTLEATLTTLQTAADGHSEALQAASTATQAANGAAQAAQQQVATLTAQLATANSAIAAYAGKPAATTPLPGATADPVTAADKPQLTSIDAEKQRLRQLVGFKN